jgi:EmrB/QacA subfamily drug resistance transporter
LIAETLWRCKVSDRGISLIADTGSRSVKPAVVMAACVAQLLVILDSTVLNVALPAIGSSLRFTEENLHLVINAFTIPFAGLLLLSGRLADLLGARNVFATGAALVLLGSLVGGTASSAEVLIAARVAQGAGSAAMVPAALALIVGTFDDKAERGKALGLWGAAGGGGGALGVLLGGLLVEYASWHWALLMNVPVCLLLFYLAARHIPNVRTAGSRRVDVIGAILVTLVLALGVIALTSSGAAGAIPASVLWAAAALALVAFIANERWWATDPIIPPRLLRNRGLVMPSFVLLLGGASLASTFYFLTLTYQLVHGYSAMQTGLAYLPLSVACFVGAGLGSALVIRVGGRLSMFLGAVLCAVGLTGFALYVNGSYWGSFFWWSVIFGFGVGVVITTTATAATDSSRVESQGVTSGVLSTSQHLGGALGLAALVGISAQSIGGDVGNAAAHASSYSVAFACCAGFAGVAALIALGSPRGSEHRAR